MLFKPLFAASSVAFAALAAADSHSTMSTATDTSSPTSTPSTNSNTIKVKVSDEQVTLKFFPEVITAAVGDTVEFAFYPKNHSIAQSSFDKPCEPLTDDDTFWSGFMPVNSTSGNLPTFSITIEDTDPKWFYCATGKHCQAGMVGVINPPPEKSIDQYRSAAAGVANTVVPSGPSTDGDGGSGTGTGTGGTGGGNATVTPGTTPTGTDDANASSTQTGGAGIVGARGWAVALAGLLAAGALAM